MWVIKHFSSFLSFSSSNPRTTEHSIFRSQEAIISPMITSIVSSLIHSKRRRRMVIELVPPRLKKVWKEWDLRVMVLLSLLLQIVLIIMGNRRKYSHKLWTTIVVWCAYLEADAIATLALGVLSNNLADFYLENSGCIVDAKTELTAFWAPFLLLHLGGPDTITSFALEDNELWLRHFLQLVVQTGTTIYVLVMSWTSSPLSVMFVLMFCAGLIKYGERTLALKSATNETLRKKLVKPSHGEFSEQNFDMIRREKRDAGYFVGVDMSNIAKEFPLHHTVFSDYNLPSDGDKLQVAYALEKATLSHILDSALNTGLRDRVHSLFRNMTPQNAFRVIEMELGLIYDRLYTKATLLYGRYIFILRLITFLLTCFVFLFFTFLHGKDKYSKIDICITFLLLAVGIFLDIYSALLILSSDRFYARLNFDKKVSTSKSRICSQPSNGPRWSNKMCQMSFLNCFLKLQWLRSRLTCERLDELLEKLWLVRQPEEISEDFQKSVFQYFKEKAATSRRENNSLQGTEGGDDWMVSEAPKFEQDPAKAILFFHIVTEVSFYLDGDGEDTKKQSEIGRQISRYMFYLLVKHPSMVSVGITQVNLQRTANTPYEESHYHSTEKETCESILGGYTGGDQTLLDAISYIKRVKQEKKDLKEKWMKLGEIWMDIMGNAAKKCKGREHGQQLRNGGELLTHVWLLMAHFGLTDHFRLSDQHHYANVIAK
ncbi:uncharacterized protein LOC123221811 [Mangifera indica]|uniref:uncharacterized protein LOC123221811 n=1 Tax=Mangifera indica TaxID=29780 RepID=UPI001CFAB29A|nr:uncharacterized protein LOC123221811 [Mangifera indica]